MIFHPYIILGAGVTGLGAGYRLRQLGIENFIILEQHDYAGGLATTFQDEQGFLWDIGGHVQFSHYDYFDKLMIQLLGKDGWYHHERESWIWMMERFIPYPFQNNIRHLPKEAQWMCIKGILHNLKQSAQVLPNTFAQWIQQSFGLGIAKLFMTPYNFKVWAYPTDLLAYNWIGERVATIDLERILHNIYHEADDISWGPNNTFQFPKQGGTGAIWKKLAAEIGEQYIKYNACVESIDSEKKVIYLKNGEQYQYGALLSTLPINLLTDIVQQTPQPLKEKAKGLLYSSTNVVGIGLKGQVPAHLAKKCWMYFPQEDSPFYRTTVFSNYSPNNVPNATEYWSLMTETSESTYKTVKQDTIIEDTIQGLKNSKLIDENTPIVSTWKYRAEYGYPTPSLQRDEILNVLQPYFENLNIFSRGRFGAWKYEVSNQDHSLMQGVEWVNRMILEIPEVTFRFPSFVNKNGGRYH